MLLLCKKSCFFFISVHSDCMRGLHYIESKYGNRVESTLLANFLKINWCIDNTYCGAVVLISFTCTPLLWDPADGKAQLTTRATTTCKVQRLHLQARPCRMRVCAYDAMLMLFTVWKPPWGQRWWGAKEVFDTWHTHTHSGCPGSPQSETVTTWSGRLISLWFV